MARPSLVVTSCSRNSWSTWVTPSMMTCCIWVSIAWRIARRSSPFSFAWENCILILLKTPCDECVCYDSFTQGNSSARFFVPSSTLRDGYATASYAPTLTYRAIFYGDIKLPQSKIIHFVNGYTKKPPHPCFILLSRKSKNRDQLTLLVQLQIMDATI